MSDVQLPRDVTVLWQLALPPIGPHHSYFEVPDLATFNRLQAALRERGFTSIRRLPQYQRLEDGQVVAVGGCVCHTGPNPGASALIDGLGSPVNSLIHQCADDNALSVKTLSVRTLAEYFCLPVDYRLMFADLYHWDPWQHQWRLQEVNDTLIRYGLPPRQRLELSGGQRILCILGVWKEPGRENVVVRYAVANAGGQRALTCDIHYDQRHDVLICLVAGGKIAVTVHVDDMRELETWKFLNYRVDRKPSNEVVIEAVGPWLPVAQVSVSSLGRRKTSGRQQVLRLLRLRARPDELQKTPQAWDKELTWKSWDEIKSCLERGCLDQETELMVNRLLRRYPRQEELFGTT